MSLKKLLPSTLLAASMLGAPAMAQTTAFGDTALAGLVGGANFVTGPVQAWYLADFPDATAQDQDFGLKISGLARVTLVDTSEFWVSVELSGAALAVTSSGNAAELVGVDNDNPVNAGFSFTSITETIADGVGSEGDNIFSVAITLANTNTEANLNDIDVNVPVRFSGCSGNVETTASAKIDIYTTDPAATPAPAPTYSADTVLIQCVSPLSISLAADAAPGTTGDSVLTIDNSGFKRGVTGTQDSAVADLANEATIGEITATFVAPVGDDGTTALPIYNSLADATISAYNQLADFGSIDLDVNITGAASDADLTLLSARSVRNSIAFGYLDAAPGPDASAKLTVDISTATENTMTGFIALTINTTMADAIAKFKNASISANIASINTMAVPASSAVAQAVTLDGLNSDLMFCGPFDWVQDSTGNANNTFRITGYGSLSAIWAKIENASKDISGDLLKMLDIDVNMLGDTTKEIIVDRSHLNTAFGNFGVADFSFGLEGIVTQTNQSNIDCDRLMFFADKQNTMASFGNDYAKAVPGSTTKDGSD